jgi:hypothetical protein
MAERRCKGNPFSKNNQLLMPIFTYEQVTISNTQDNAEG